MLLPRLAKRFVFVLVCVFLALVAIRYYTWVDMPTWVWALTVPAAAFFTFLYWRSFKGSKLCERCGGTGKVMVTKGRETFSDLCPSCDGEGRISPLF